MITTIIFSKGRPAQLDLLLRSIERNYDISNVKTIVAPDYNSIGLAYQEIERCYGIIYEGDLKSQILEMMDDKNEHVMFLCDDCVFIRPFKVSDKEFKNYRDNENVLGLSLRLNHYLNYCYAFDSIITVPNIHNGAYIWKGASGDYGYPMSLDGHIYRKSDIRGILDKIEFNSPNQLEGELNNHVPDRALTMCYMDSRVINLPINRVQTNNDNRHGKYDIHEMNDRFMEGKRINLDNLQGLKNTSVHVERDIEWIG